MGSCLSLPLAASLLLTGPLVIYVRSRCIWVKFVNERLIQVKCLDFLISL